LIDWDMAPTNRRIDWILEWYHGLWNPAHCKLRMNCKLNGPEKNRI
jgi:hypothetical protein